MPKRDLDLKDLDAVLEEAKRLHVSGYENTGEWDLSQICEHLCSPLAMPIDGPPFRANFVMRTIARLLVKKKFFRTRHLKPGIPAPDSAVFESSDEAAAIEKLEKAIARFAEHAGPLKEHPFFGNLSKQEWHDFNAIHGAHHLACLIPKTN